MSIRIKVSMWYVHSTQRQTMRMAKCVDDYVITCFTMFTFTKQFRIYF